MKYLKHRNGISFGILKNIWKVSRLQYTKSLIRETKGIAKIFTEFECIDKGIEMTVDYNYQLHKRNVCFSTNLG